MLLMSAMAFGKCTGAKLLLTVVKSPLRLLFLQNMRVGFQRRNFFCMRFHQTFNMRFMRLTKACKLRRQG